jgi:hypothetical protein
MIVGDGVEVKGVRSAECGVWSVEWV